MTPRPRFEKLDAERRERLLAVAEQEFIEHGYQEASTNRILEAAGISKGAFYYYFDDKADLFATLLRRLTSLSFELLELDLDALTAETFWSCLEAVGEASVRLAREHPSLIGLGRVWYDLSEQVRRLPPVATWYAEARARLAEIVARGQALGVIRDDLPAGMLVDVMMATGEAMKRWLMAHWDELTEAEAIAFRGQSVDLLLRVARPAPHPSIEAASAGPAKKRTPARKRAGSTPGKRAGSTPGKRAGSTPGKRAGSTPGKRAGSTPGKRAGPTPGKRARPTPGKGAGSTPGGPTRSGSGKALAKAPRAKGSPAPRSKGGSRSSRSSEQARRGRPPKGTRS